MEIKRRVDQKRAAWIEQGNRHPMLVVNQPLFAGRVITLVDLETVKAAYHVLGKWIKQQEGDTVDIPDELVKEGK